MYETACRLADWSIIDHHRVIDTLADTSTNLLSVKSADYDASHYRALKCLCDSDIVGLKSAVDNGRVSVVKSLHNMSLECSQTVYPMLLQLHLLREIEEFAPKKPDEYGDVFDAWHAENFINTHDFRYVEPILSQRLVMYRTRSTGFPDLNINRAMIRTHLEIDEVAKKQGYFLIAARSLDTLAKTDDLSNHARDQLTYREAVLSSKRNDQDIGRYLLRNLIKKSPMDLSLRDKSLRVYGNWMAETKSENPRAAKEYYNESIKTSFSIDERIAFAQGKVLPIPETVSCRLTRDMEVAMGICGVERAMRRSCEETVTVLRDRQKILMTLLQVLLYDPLFSWAITPVKSEESCVGHRYGGRTTGETSPKKTNKIAKRALLRIEQKLQGTEDGLVSSIPGQVKRLIQQARDPSNLCRIFHGWQPYL